MSLDLTEQYNEAIENLKTWRNRYNKNVYPSKVVENIFYGNLTMTIIADKVSNYFSGNLSKMTFESSYKLIEDSYGKVALEKSQKLLPLILSQKADFLLGNIKYETFIPQIDRASSGNNVEIESIEFAYIFYFLSNIAVKSWCAFGISGENKINAITKLSNVIIEKTEIDNYSQIENILGKLIVAPFLNTKYSPLPNLF
jgi:hypothetical protein